MNLIENLRGIVAKKVYDQEKSEENIIKLQKKRKKKEATKSAWANIPNETLNKLVGSVANGLTKVIKNK